MQNQRDDDDEKEVHRGVCQSHAKSIFDEDGCLMACGLWMSVNL